MFQVDKRPIPELGAPIREVFGHDVGVGVDFQHESPSYSSRGRILRRSNRLVGLTCHPAHRADTQ